MNESLTLTYWKALVVMSSTSDTDAPHTTSPRLIRSVEVRAAASPERVRVR